MFKPAAPQTSGYEFALPAGTVTGINDSLTLSLGDQPADDQPARLTLTFQADAGWRSRFNLKTDAKDPVTGEPDQFDMFPDKKEFGLGALASLVLVRGLDLALASAFAYKWGIGDGVPGMLATDVALSINPAVGPGKLSLGAAVMYSRSQDTPSPARTTAIGGTVGYEVGKYNLSLGANHFDNHAERFIDGRGADIVLTPGGALSSVTVPTGTVGMEYSASLLAKLPGDWEFGLNFTVDDSSHVEGPAATRTWTLGPTLKKTAK